MERRSYIKQLFCTCLLLMACLATSAIEIRNGVYIISTADDLDEFAEIVYNENRFADAILTNDIDFRGHFGVIGNITKTAYSGTFNGQAHKITISYNAGYDNCALFRYVSEKGRIINLHVDGTLNTTSHHAAGIVANLEGGELNNCLCTVNISSTYKGDCSLGGLVGFSKRNSRIINCVYVGTLKAPNGTRVGGLVGWVDSPTTLIRNCLVIGQAEVSSLENSNSVARSTYPENIILDNVRYVNDMNQTIEGAEKIKLEEFLSGETYYKVFETQLQEVEEQLEEKDRKLNTYLYFIFGALAVLVLQAVMLVIYHVVNTRIRKKLRRQYEDFERVKQQLAALTEVKEIPIEALKEPEIEIPEPDAPVDNDAEEEPIPEEHVELDEEQMLNLQILYQKLLQVMDEKQLYVNPKLNLAMLAREVCTNQSRLSLCINKVSGQNLSSWLGHYRVSHAMKLMDANPSIREEEIREKAGFSSHSSYYRVFHKVTGYTPKQYIATRVLHERS